MNLDKVTQLSSGKIRIQTQLPQTPQSPGPLSVEIRIKLNDVSTWKLKGERLRNRILVCALQYVL